MSKVINKVVYNDRTLIDLTQDTVTASKLAQGYTAHSASGAQITGTMPEGGGGGLFGFEIVDRHLKMTYDTEPSYTFSISNGHLFVTCDESLSHNFAITDEHLRLTF